jgi:hypothetical protein
VAVLTVGYGASFGPRGVARHVEFMCLNVSVNIETDSVPPVASSSIDDRATD